MDDQELHYLTYDPDEIMADMITSYYEAGGETLYAGDEKQILLQAVLQIMMQAFAGMDNALRMDTLRYAVRDYLDVYGEKRNCIRIPAMAATAEVKITLEATGEENTIPAGTAMTADGTIIYATTEDITTGGYAQELTVEVVCNQSGSIGNSLLEGTEMQSLVPINGVTAIICTASASGGQDEETDEAYRERIRTYGLASVSTGPQQQYESAAKEVSSEIIDARALNLGAGRVGIYLIFASDTGKEALIESVRSALNAADTRPLTDTVTVAEATKIQYTLNIRYSFDGSSGVQELINSAIEEWKEWQETSIGRPFNPERLQAVMYQAGATRVIWASGSEFNGGTVEYTEIAENAYCTGDITTAVIAT